MIRGFLFAAGCAAMACAIIGWCCVCVGARAELESDDWD